MKITISPNSFKFGEIKIRSFYEKFDTKTRLYVSLALQSPHPGP